MVEGEEGIKPAREKRGMYQLGPGVRGSGLTGSDGLSTLCSRSPPRRKKGGRTGMGLPVYLELSTGISSQFVQRFFSARINSAFNPHPVCTRCLVN